MNVNILTRDRIVCWFSCGAASAVATKLTLGGVFPGKDVVIARCVVREEHPDNERFARDCEKWFGQPILNLIAETYDGSVHEVIRKHRFISGPKGAPCTMRLKKHVREAFQRPTDHHIFGYCMGEEDRWNRFIDANNISASAPLIEDGLTHDDTLILLQRAGIELPMMYHLGYEHNNCIGCVKSTGAGYWNKIRVDFPMQFDKMATVSRALGSRMVRVHGERVFLDELPEGYGKYGDEPEVQCGPFCEMADADFKAQDGE